MSNFTNLVSRNVYVLMPTIIHMYICAYVDSYAHAVCSDRVCIACM